MKINEILKDIVKDTGLSALNTIGKQVGMSREIYPKQSTKTNAPAAPTTVPATTTTPTATKAASTTIPALKPDQVAFLDINGSKVFLSKDGKNWMIYQGANWPQDLGTSQVITAQNSLDAIDAAMAAGKLQIASTKKTANFSKPGFSGYQTK